MKTKVIPTQEMVRQHFIYDPATGKLFNRGGQRPLQESGTMHYKGYRTVSIKKTSFLAHRIVWLYVHGEMPNGLIDHINGNRTDNRIENLRCVTCAQNQQNFRAARRDSLTGIPGVTFHKATNMYWSRIQTNRKLKSLGYFHSAADAYSAYVTAKRELHPYSTLPDTWPTGGVGRGLAESDPRHKAAVKRALEAGPLNGARAEWTEETGDKYTVREA